VNEFNLIEHYFTHLTATRSDTLLGINDDAAIVKVPPNNNLVTCMDTLVAGVHFPLDTSPFDIGYKALAVNLSDMAAMGATPCWLTLALTLPQAEESWLQAFSQGMKLLCDNYQLQLIGGDTTQGPLTVTVQVLGTLPKHLALQRSGAQTDDLIFVSGDLAAAGIGLQICQHKLQLPALVNDYCLARLHRPQPRITMGQALLTIAHSAIDISDGLSGDLQHILKQSNKGAIVNVDQLPIYPALRDHFSAEKLYQLALAAGDDYELCFTVAPDKIVELQQALINDKYTCIGKITAAPDLHLQFSDNSPFQTESPSYQHFGQS